MEERECLFCGKLVSACGCAGRVVKGVEGTAKIAVEAAVEVLGGKFDRRAYQREYMRGWRKRRKLGRKGK